jgi:hypothetical protein
MAKDGVRFMILWLKILGKHKRAYERGGYIEAYDTHITGIFSSLSYSFGSGI